MPSYVDQGNAWRIFLDEMVVGKVINGHVLYEYQKLLIHLALLLVGEFLDSKEERIDQWPDVFGVIIPEVDLVAVQRFPILLEVGDHEILVLDLYGL